MNRRLRARQPRTDWTGTRSKDWRFLGGSTSEDFIENLWYKDFDYSEQVYTDYYRFHYDEPQYWQIESLIKYNQENVDGVRQYYEALPMDWDDELFVKAIYQFWAADKNERRDLLIVLELSNG